MAAKHRGVTWGLIMALCSLMAFLTGCAGAAATAIEDARALHDSAKGYVSDVHNARREIRRKCWDILEKEVEQLEQAGDYDTARERLKANYPRLVTVDIFKSAKNDDVDDDRDLSKPFGCN